MRSVPSVILLAVFALTLTGCVQDDTGVRCTVAGGGEENLEFTGFNLQALECESRICIQYRAAKSARCTQPCDSDSDCPEDAIAGCKKGFVCRVGQLSLKSAIGCCRFCVCADDVTDDDPLRAGCEGKTAKCPKI